MSESIIAHIATHSTNIGDGALIDGLQNKLKQSVDRELLFLNEDLMDFTLYRCKRFDSSYVDWLNKSADLLIIGGGGMIDGGKKNANSGLALPFDLNVFSRLKIPVIFYAVGHNLFPGQRFYHKEKLRATIRATVDNNGLFSVRNDGSKKRLQMLFDDPLPEVWSVPDPGLYVSTRKCFIPQIRDDTYNILLQLAGDNLDLRFRRTSSPVQVFSHIVGIGKDPLTQFLRGLQSALEQLASEFKINIILTPHLTRDLKIISEFVSKLGKKFERSVLDTYGVLRGREYAPHFFEIYRQADLVLGMRGHSVIAAVGLDTPVIALASHPKVEGFMEECGLEEYIVDVRDPDLKDRIYSLSKRLLQDPSDWKAKRQKAMMRFEAETAEFNREVIRRLPELGVS